MNNKTIQVIDKNSPYYNKKGKVISYDADTDTYGLLINDDLIFFHKGSLNLTDKKVFVPQSRKQLYEFIQNSKTQLNDIESTLAFLIKTSKIESLEFDSETLISHIVEAGTKDDMVFLMRSLRDQKKININLVNNHNQNLKQRQI